MSSRVDGEAPTARQSAPEDESAIELHTLSSVIVEPTRTDEPPGTTGAGALPKPGTRIGQYEVIRELGRGGMGAVYLARDTKLGRRVAIKFLQTENPELTTRFILEARTTAQCTHENIVVIHQVDEHEGSPFMVLEFLQGTSIGNLLRDGRKLPPNRAVEYIVPVVRALERAHAHGIVHRDLKPDNIFLTDSGTVKVLDFGIAKLIQDQQLADPTPARLPPNLSDDLPDDLPDIPDTDTARSNPPTPALTRHGMIIGTLPYMSPEQWRADAPNSIDHRTDLWAIGILLFRMVAGKHPLAPLHGRQLIVTAALEKPMPRARDACPDIPDELADIIDRCLVKHREQRIGSARELLDLLEQLLPGERARGFRASELPYAGLRSFQEADAKRFFGRTREITAAATRLQNRSLLGVVGPSGVGKSSFVRAGLVPALKQSGESWSALVIRPGRTPVSTLARAVAPMIVQSATTVAGDVSDYRTVLERLYQQPGYLGVILRSRARRKDQKLLVFVDQFEELYTLVADPAERLAFTRCLASVADDATSPLRVVVSLRSDFLDRVAEDEHFMAELAQGLFFLAPPNRAGLRDALILPAQMAGYEFEDEDMVEDMLDHLEHVPGALPLVQFAATKLWELRDTQARLLTRQSYDDIGGIEGALASHADAVVAELPARGRGLARALLLALVTPERTRAIVPVTDLYELSRQPGEIQPLIDHLVQARLLVVQTGDAGAAGTVEIVHESLLHGWPRLRRWLDENQDDAGFLDQLRSAAKQWQAKGYPQGLLWRGEAMEEARLWHRRYRGELTSLQQAFLTAVFALSARASRRKRAAVIGVITLLSLLVAAGAIALLQIRAAEHEATAQAEAARTAEDQVRAQLETVQSAHQARARAEQATVQAKERVEQANIALDDKNEELIRKNAELLNALERANEARQRADAESRRAQSNEEVARRAEADALRAEAETRRINAELQNLLAHERERLRQLQEQSGTTAVIEDVKTR